MILSIILLYCNDEATSEKPSKDFILEEIEREEIISDHGSRDKPRSDELQHANKTPRYLLPPFATSLGRDAAAWLGMAVSSGDVSSILDLFLHTIHIISGCSKWLNYRLSITQLPDGNIRDLPHEIYACSS